MAFGRIPLEKLCEIEKKRSKTVHPAQSYALPKFSASSTPSNPPATTELPILLPCFHLSGLRFSTSCYQNCGRSDLMVEKRRSRVVAPQSFSERKQPAVR
ncbi:hypothetical protein Nepgr_010825 [Nepenthes gracilis]|uniref:Uncharacterized protein n=1 Tax=Nepenthes gracilis TaxID=150966 RepID=A0AAD3XLP9_NEPGR|nr:hypothetical protein Nepgr_010825 [Nepenthes gracilis]